MKKVIPIAAIIIAGAIGYFLGTQNLGNYLIYEDGVLYHENGVFFKGEQGIEGMYELNHRITVEGVAVHGNIVSIKLKDLQAIRDELSTIKDVEPILSIRVIDANRVKVTTGKTEGPLSGGGMMYRFKRMENEWSLVDTAHWIG